MEVKANKLGFSTQPVMFAAWPGMGNVGLITIDYLRRKTESQLFAGIDMTPLLAPEEIVVQDGIARLPDAPDSVFHYHQNPDLIIFESNAQLGGKEGVAIAKGIVEVARQFGVSRIYTAAAFAQPMSHVDKSDVIFASNSESVKMELEGLGVHTMPDGHITGLNGLLLGIAGTNKMDAACFLGTIPAYASNIAYPKASLEILRVISSILGVSFDLSDLEGDVDSIDEQLDAVEERIKQLFPAAVEPQGELAEIEAEEVPQYIMEKIERLFGEVNRDKSRANELREELIRWNLFDLYEKRFLNLFRGETKDDDSHEKK